MKSVLFLRLAGLGFIMCITVMPACRKTDAMSDDRVWSFAKFTPESWNTVTYEQAHGRSWSAVLLNPAESSDYIGFRARYTLVEPEFEIVQPGYVWKHTRASDWMPLSLFSTIKFNATFVRQIRPAGAGGWVRGMMVRAAAEKTPPVEIFRRLSFSVQSPKAESSMRVPVMRGEGVIGALVDDYPDGVISRGPRLSELQGKRPLVIDIDSPEHEAQIKNLAKAGLEQLEEDKLPWPIKRLPKTERSVVLERYDDTMTLIQRTFVRPTTWEGTMLIEARSIPVRVEASYSPNADSPVDSRLSLRIASLDGARGTVRVEGPLDPNAGPTMCSHFKMNTRNLTEQGPAIIAQRLHASSAPLGHDDAMVNCLVRLVNSNTMEISAAGIPAFVLSRKK